MAARGARTLLAQRAYVGFQRWVRRDPLATIFTVAGRRDPYPVYERLRARGPVSRSSMRMLVTVDHVVCHEVLRSRDFGVGNPGQDAELINLSLLQLDPPDHTRLRSLVAPAFRPGRMRAQEGRIQRAVDQLVDDLADRLTTGPADLMTAFAKPLPVVMITALLGIPDAEIDTLARHGDAIGSVLDGVQSMRHLRQVFIARQELHAMFERLVDLRRRHPGDDVVSDIIPALDDGRISADELNDLAQLLLVAGFETTVNLIGNAMTGLLERPHLWRRLVEDPSLADRVIEETLRWDAPVQLTGRIALLDVDLAGSHIPAGAMVLTILGGANRDPQVFTDPAEFNIDRPNAREHLSFSTGIHHCIGRPLAMIEARLALVALARRLPDLVLAGNPVLASGLTLRGRRSLPVRV